MKARRDSTCALVRQAIHGAQWEGAIMTICIYYPTREARDVLNTIEAIKSDIDGIRDSGLLKDDDWTRLRPTIAEPQLDREDPRIVLVLEESQRL